MDCSLGLVTTRQWDDMESMLGFLSQLSIHELVLDPQSVEHEAITDFFRQSRNLMITIHPLPPNPDSIIARFCPPESVDIHSKGEKRAVACAFSYLLSLTPYKHFASIPLDGWRIITHSADDILRLDPVTLKNLEIFAPLNQNTDSSLFSLLDTCASAP
jgi:DNA mismatch repair ATPase MutS